MAALTLADALASSASTNAGITYFEQEGDALRLTYGELQHRALRLLGEFQAQGLTPGSNVLLQLHGNPQLVDAFWACQLGGMVAVPIAVGSTDEHQLKTLNVLDQLEQPRLVTQDRNPERLWEFARRVGTYDQHQGAFKQAIDISQIPANGPLGKPHTAAPTDVASLQFSSGSTGTPKGVVLTHEGLLADINAIIARAELSATDSHLSWVPLTHDLGMVMFHLMPIVLGAQQYLIPSMRFARRPLAWLNYADQTQATVLCSPNFGYEHYLKSFAKHPQQLDLSAVHTIFNGGEPISKPLCDAFTEALGDCRLSATAIRPAYGLAEAGVAVTMTQPGNPVESLRVDRQSLEVGAQVVIQEPGAANAAEVVCVGTPVRDCEVQIGTLAGEPLAQGAYGHIFINGPVVSPRYYGQTSNRSSSGWLDTGDLGFFHNGNLYVLGRAKDAIIINGVNYHPSDLERICCGAAELEAGKVTCCSVQGHSGNEQLAVFVTFRGEVQAFKPTVRAIRRCLAEQTQLDVPFVLPVGRMPKTSSGKIQRYKLSEEFANGVYNEIIELLNETDSPHPENGQDDLETRLYNIVNTVLPDVQLSMQDSFLDAGVSSLALAEIAEAVDDAYPDVLELSDYLEHQTISEIAVLLQQRLAT